jgi:pimeloyl-ACP methyl ester carboxylesterase
VGWSDGGMVGLLVAMARRDLVRKLIVIGTNFDTAGLTPEAMEGFTTLSADSDDLAMLREAYQTASPDGPGHWPLMVDKFKEMVSMQPAITLEQLARITAARLVVVGDHDIVALTTPRLCSERSRTPS